jgi:hypothetical protein
MFGGVFERDNKNVKYERKSLINDLHKNFVKSFGMNRYAILAKQ